MFIGTRHFVHTHALNVLIDLSTGDGEDREVQQYAMGGLMRLCR